jgi:hypothetical protein
VALLAFVLVFEGIALNISAEEVFVGFSKLPGRSEEALVRAFGGKIKYTYRIVPAIAVDLPAPAIAQLRANPTVTHIVPNTRVYALDTELDNSWGVGHIGAGNVHNGGNKGAGMKVAVIDTGIDYDHPDLAANYAGGYDFVNLDNDPRDDNGHGTHVSGIIASVDNDAGVVGVAPEAEIYALKALDAEGNGYVFDIIAAMEWATGGGDPATYPGGIPFKTHIINMSLGAPVGNLFLELACIWTYEDDGLLIVAAAGNDGNSSGTGNNVNYPGAYDSVMAVTATDSDDVRAYFSSTGTQIEIAGPGVGVNSTMPTYEVTLSAEYGYDYGILRGTSMASPHVAGTAALVWAAEPGLTNFAVRTRLQQTADDLGDPGIDYWYGYGLVDAYEAAGAPPLADEPPIVIITSYTDGAIVSGVVDVTANASDDDGVTQVEFFVDDASIGVDSDDSNGWSVTWDTTLYADGDHTLTATATDTKPQTASDSINVTVDNVDDPPTIAITNPGNGDFVSGTVNITADASDDKGVTQVEFFVDGLSIGVDADDSDGWSASWDVTGANGGHTVSATATDTTGQTASDSVNVTADEPPMVTITNPSDGATVSSIVDLTADADDDSSVTQVEFSVDGSSIGTDTYGADGWSVSWETTSEANGVHTITATAMDTVGQTASDSINVTVDNAVSITGGVYVWDMSWSEKKRRGIINLTIQIDVNRDTDNDAAQANDKPARYVLVDLVVTCFDANGELVGQWIFNEGRLTNKRGIISFAVENAPAGDYIAIAALDDPDWNPFLNLDQDNPSEYHGVPGGSEPE